MQAKEGVPPKHRTWEKRGFPYVSWARFHVWICRIYQQTTPENCVPPKTPTCADQKHVNEEFLQTWSLSGKNWEAMPWLTSQLTRAERMAFENTSLKGRWFVLGRLAPETGPIFGLNPGCPQLKYPVALGQRGFSGKSGRLGWWKMWNMGKREELGWLWLILVSQWDKLIFKHMLGV